MAVDFNNGQTDAIKLGVDGQRGYAEANQSQKKGTQPRRFT